MKERVSKMTDYANSDGLNFLIRTKHSRQELLDRKRRENILPAAFYKQYEKARILELPEPNPAPYDLWSALANRRSERKYAKGDLSLQGLSCLLWASQGITGKTGHYLLKTAPSAGALYPIETYLLINNVQDVPCGIYHYNIPFGHLEEISLGSFGRQLGDCCLGQPMCWNAQVVFIWSAIPRRTMCKYGSRGMRYVFMDVGHICQNLLIAASAIGLGACPIGAFFDDEVNELIGLDGIEETVVYLASVGLLNR